jgi:hypothetical protein
LSLSSGGGTSRIARVWRFCFTNERLRSMRGSLTGQTARVVFFTLQARVGIVDRCEIGEIYTHLLVLNSMSCIFRQAYKTQCESDLTNFVSTWFRWKYSIFFSHFRLQTHLACCFFLYR